jgi:adenine-specific DNA-methyltransferase
VIAKLGPCNTIQHEGSAFSDVIGRKNSMTDSARSGTNGERELREALEEARAENARLKSRTRFGLVWENQPEDVEQLMAARLPILEHKKSLEVPGGLPSDRHHLLIEGDNLHALTVMQATHAESVDVIYIDPPYNTGNDFIYNDTLIDSDHRWRHSAWLSFMEKRLRLAQNLMTDSGLIFISIDDNEQAHLRLLCDAIFGEKNFVAMFVWQKKRKGSHLSKTVRQITEYVICYAKGDTKGIVLDGPPAKADQRQGLLNRPNPVGELTFPAGTEIGAPDGKFAPTKFGSDALSVELVTPVHVKGGVSQSAFTVRGRFKWGQENLNREIEAGSHFAFSAPRGRGAGWKPTVLKHDQASKLLRPPSLLSKDWSPEVGTNEDGSDELEAIFGDREVFDFPKPSSLIKYLVRSAASRNPHAVILDFFAGTGTTLHAVANLNAEDGGSRQAILITNNENGICRDITHPRAKAVLTGKWADGKKRDPLPGSLSFYTTDFLTHRQNRDQAFLDFAARSADIIAVKEGAHAREVTEAALTVLRGNGRTVAIVTDSFDEHAGFAAAAGRIAKKGEVRRAYVFTWSDDGVEAEIVEQWKGWEVRPLPAPLLAAIRRRMNQDSGGMK